MQTLLKELGFFGKFKSLNSFILVVIGLHFKWYSLYNNLVEILSSLTSFNSELIYETINLSKHLKVVLGWQIGQSKSAFLLRIAKRSGTRQQPRLAFESCEATDRNRLSIIEIKAI